MHVHVFHAPGWWALTEDKSGERLPDEAGPWTYLQDANLARGDGDKVGINATAAIIGIVDNGYYLHPLKEQK